MAPVPNTIKPFDLAGFETYLKVTHNKSNDTARSIIRDVNLYLVDFEPKEKDENKLLNASKLARFLRHMEEIKKYKATTRAEKLRRLKLAIKFRTREEENQELYHQGSRVTAMIDEWCHGLAKDISIQRQTHALKMRERLHEVVDPNEVLDNDMVRKYIYHLFILMALFVYSLICDI